MQQMHRKNEKVGRKSSLSTATALQSQNGAVQSPLYSLSGPLPFSPSILPPHLSSLVPFQAVFLKHGTKPLTCHHFASLGPLAANPEIYTWEAEGALRSPNQPFFLKGWATSNKGWRRAARSREC